MLEIRATIENGKVVIGGLQRLADDMPRVVQSGLTKVAQQIHIAALKRLSGEGSKGTYVKTKSGKKRWKKREVAVPSGGYPVPVRTANLKRLLWWQAPKADAQNYKGERDSLFKTGDFQVIIYNSAEYANVIHEGKMSSKKFGPRPYLNDALKDTDVAGIVQKAIKEALRGKGL